MTTPSTSYLEWSDSMSDEGMEAGKGEHNLYWPAERGSASDNTTLQADLHYLGIDAVRWYVNRKSNLLRDRMASGTANVEVGDEKFEVGLGLYELKHGEHTAPIFNSNMLNNRIYKGGLIHFHVFVRVLQEDTLLGGLLRDMAKASVEVVGGAVAAATAAGPSKVLLAAGSSLVDGVKKILTEGKRPITILDPGGVQITLSAKDVVGAETYMLVHRGSSLQKDKLEIIKRGTADYEVLYNGQPLADGAWILLRLRREELFGSSRPWQDDARRVRNALDGLMEELRTGRRTSDEVRSQLRPSGKAPLNVADQILGMNAVIRADFVLTATEASAYASALELLLLAAQESVDEKGPEHYAAIRTGLMKHGERTVPPRVAAILDSQVRAATEVRAIARAVEEPALNSAALWNLIPDLGIWRDAE